MVSILLEALSITKYCLVNKVIVLNTRRVSIIGGDNRQQFNDDDSHLISMPHQIFTEVKIHTLFFWIMIPCIQLHGNHNFDGTYRLHLQI
jgi:hypothetical protein